MKVVILAGGLGSRLSEETQSKPKPMVEIGGRPILWHIMNIYASYGFKEFVLALGYRGEIIKNYFLNYYYLRNNFSIELSNGKIKVHDGKREDWNPFFGPYPTKQLADARCASGLALQYGPAFARDWEKLKNG